MFEYDEIPYDLCADCVSCYFNDDLSSLSLRDEDEANNRETAIRQGLDREFGSRLFAGLEQAADDSGDHFGSCDCCNVRGSVASYIAHFKRTQTCEVETLYIRAERLMRSGKRPDPFTTVNVEGMERLAVVKGNPKPRLDVYGYTLRGGSPTALMTKIGSRWHRIYALQFSNNGSLFVRIKGKPVFVEVYRHHH